MSQSFWEYEFNRETDMMPVLVTPCGCQTQKTRVWNQQFPKNESHDRGAVVISLAPGENKVKIDMINYRNYLKLHSEKYI